MIRKPVLLLLTVAQIALPHFALAQDCDAHDTVPWIYVSFAGCTPGPDQGPIKLPELASSRSREPQAEYKNVGGTSYWVYELDPDRRVDNLSLTVSNLRGFRVKGPVTGKPARIDGACVGHYHFACERAWTAVIWATPGKATVHYKDDVDGRQEDHMTRFRVEGLHLDATLELDVRDGEKSICRTTFNSDEEPQKVDLAECLNELLLRKSKDKGSSPPNAISLGVQLDQLGIKFLYIKREP